MERQRSYHNSNHLIQEELASNFLRQFHYVVLVVLELTLSIRLALNSERPGSCCLSAGIKARALIPGYLTQRHTAQASSHLESSCFSRNYRAGTTRVHHHAWQCWVTRVYLHTWPKAILKPHGKAYQQPPKLRNGWKNMQISNRNTNTKINRKRTFQHRI